MATKREVVYVSDLKDGDEFGHIDGDHPLAVFRGFDGSNLTISALDDEGEPDPWRATLHLVDYMEKFARYTEVEGVEKRSFGVEGSSGQFYRVTNVGEHWICSCPDYVYREHECKHIRQTKEEQEN